MKLPNWYGLLLLAAASYRVWRLLAEDAILDQPRRYVTRIGKWEKEGDPVPREARLWLTRLMDCVWCSGWWVAVAWWAFWEAWPHWTIIISAPFAISALVGLVHRSEND